MVKAFIFGLTIAITITSIAVMIINRGLDADLKSGLLNGLGYVQIKKRAAQATFGGYISSILYHILLSAYLYHIL